MKEEALGKLILLPVQIGSNDLECRILIGDRVDELTMEKAVYHAETMKKPIDILVQSFIEAEPSKDISKLRKILIRGFIYCFDKAVEDVYNLRARPTANINFDLTDIFTGESGDEIPEYIQLKVTPCIGSIGTIYNKLVDHIEEIEDELSEVGIYYEDTIKSILYGGMYLGTEFCLRIDLENSDEMDALLND